MYLTAKLKEAILELVGAAVSGTCPDHAITNLIILGQMNIPSESTREGHIICTFTDVLVAL